jgi:hypothetical protein
MEIRTEQNDSGSTTKTPITTTTVKRDGVKIGWFARRQGRIIEGATVWPGKLKCREALRFHGGESDLEAVTVIERRSR